MLLEHGAITVVARPRVRREEIESLDDVQRMLWVLAPSIAIYRLSPEFLAHPGAELVLIAR